MRFPIRKIHLLLFSNALTKSEWVSKWVMYVNSMCAIGKQLGEAFSQAPTCHDLWPPHDGGPVVEGWAHNPRALRFWTLEWRKFVCKSELTADLCLHANQKSGAAADVPFNESSGALGSCASFRWCVCRRVHVDASSYLMSYRLLSSETKHGVSDVFQNNSCQGFRTLWLLWTCSMEAFYGFIIYSF